MRIGVLDVGSNTAHLKIVDVHPGQPPRVVMAVKHPTRLAEAIDSRGAVDDKAVGRLVRAVEEAAAVAAAQGVDELIAFATAAVRDAANRDEIVTRVAAATGLHLGSLLGEADARLTFMAAREWYGWSAGRLLLLDIGGGSLEIACGEGREPRVALSLPLGAGRLTRDHLPGDPPPAKRVRALRRLVYEHLAEAARELDGRPVKAVGTSKTFTQLARLTGAPGAKAGPYALRVLKLGRLRKQIPLLANTDSRGRAKLKGLSKPRARQILAGAIVAEAAMTILQITEIDICPWALREGVLARRLRAMSDPAATDTQIQDLTQILAPRRCGLLRPVPTIGA
jgi:exopolyphosphatase/guanosine-5'-triphosphate,3'-diphosphate pyrophosphatase